MARRRAMIVKFGRIGDVIITIPAAYVLHQRGFEIDWVCGKGAQPLLECYSWIRTVDADDHAILFGKPLERVRALAGFWSAIAGRRYDVCATLYYDFRYRLLTLPIRARQRFYFSSHARSRRLVAGRHLSSEFARLLLGREDICAVESSALVAPDRLPLSPFLSKPALRRIALVPSGAPNLVRQQAESTHFKQLFRRWPIESYLALADYLLHRGWEVVVIGGPDDHWVSEKFHALPVNDCVGKLSLPQVVSAFNDCDAVICHDTGPMHLAGLSRCCLLAIFGPTDPWVFLPRRPYSVGIWGGQGFACRPCYDLRVFAPCQFNGCMHQVTLELVLREMDRLLSDREQGLPSPWRIVFPEPAPETDLVDVRALGSALR